jgi:hypothetical protein
MNKRDDNPIPRSSRPAIVSKQMTPGEISVGHCITIYEPVETEREESLFDFFGGGRERQRHHLTGVPLKVMAIDLPFVAVRLASGERFSLDTRLFRLMEMREEFASALYARDQAAAGDEVPQSQLLDAINRMATVLNQNVLPRLERLDKPPEPPAPPPATPTLLQRFLKKFTR